MTQHNTYNKKIQQIVIIGSGAIATAVIDKIPKHIVITHILTTPKSRALTQEKYPHIRVVDEVSQITSSPDFVIECAGHNAVKMHAETILKQGWPLYIISTGVFADETLYHHLLHLAEQNTTRLHLLTGAIAGMDGLRCAKQIHNKQSPVSVTYHGVKPVQGWLGTHAENLIDLTSLSERTCFFQGTAREAATLFPQNANVAATIALNGIGFDDTLVALYACPISNKNTHTIDISGDFGEINLVLAGNPLPDNPKTSYLTALSILQLFDE